jgi:hypothetical protein
MRNLQECDVHSENTFFLRKELLIVKAEFPDAFVVEK